MVNVQSVSTWQSKPNAKLLWRSDCTSIHYNSTCPWNARLPILSALHRTDARCFISCWHFVSVSLPGKMVQKSHCPEKARKPVTTSILWRKVHFSAELFRGGLELVARVGHVPRGAFGGRNFQRLPWPLEPTSKQTDLLWCFFVGVNRLHSFQKKTGFNGKALKDDIRTGQIPAKKQSMCGDT